jgi:DeoR/GlpR family transcriptional regulator of sugar metabolism
MATAARDEAVLDVLRSTRAASVADLATELGVTESTVRRTLQRLAHDGRVIRTYGGATVVDGPPAGALADTASAAKGAIGLAARELVADGSTIALSSGTTVLAMARQLRDRRVTVITNALDVANALLDAPGIELVVLGGVVLPGMHSLRGHLAEEALRDLRADTVFMGASAIDLDTGCMTEQIPEIGIDRALRGAAREAVILVESAKIGHRAPGFMFGLDRVATIVTDAGIDTETKRALEERGIRVIVGDERSHPRATQRGLEVSG